MDWAQLRWAWLVEIAGLEVLALLAFVRRMLERKVEGVAVLTFGEEEPVLDQLTNHDVPMVLAEFKLGDPKSSTIVLDYTTGMDEAVKHLAGLGHRRIGFLAGPHSIHSAVTRENEFRGAMKRAELPIEAEWVIECDHTLRGGVNGLERLRGLKRQPTAVICSNDMTAIGVLRAAYMEGLRVPQDLSVIGLDDIAFDEYTLPPLTTIRMSRAELARAAFEALRVQAEAAPGAKVPHEFLVSTSLVVRESTAAPSKA